VPAGKDGGTDGAHGRGSANRNQDDEENGRYEDRYGRMNDDAQRAVVRGAFLGVDMDHLHHGQ
jgi:hypothetical protein